MNLDNYVTDKNLAENGAEFHFDGARFLVRSTSSQAYKKALRKHTTGTTRAMKRNADKITAEIMADSLVLGWNGITNKGQEFPFNRENALAVLTQSDKLRNAIYAFADEPANFNPDAEKDEEEEQPLADLKSESELDASTGGRD